MKRFLFSIAVSITLITLGCTTLFFEFHSFEIVDADVDPMLISKTYQIEEIIKNEEIIIDVDDADVYVDIKEDLDDKDEIMIEYPQYLEVKEKRNKLIFDGNITSRHSYSHIKDRIDNFVEGLKDKKIQVNYKQYRNEIIVHCSPENRKIVQVDYN